MPKLADVFFPGFDKQHLRLSLFGIICIACLVLWQSAGKEFIYDSIVVLNGDPRIQTLSRENLVDISTKNYWWPNAQSDLYRPITTLSFLINKSVFGAGQNPIPYQISNAGVHLLNAALAFSLLLRLGVCRWVATLSVVFFVVHPSLSEVVPNIVGRADLLANLAILTGFHLYLFSREAERPSILWGVGLVGIMGVYSKESAVALGALILLHGILFPRLANDTDGEKIYLGLRDFFYGVRSNRKMLIRLSAVTLALLIAAVVPKLMLSGPGFNPESVSLDNPLLLVDFWTSRVNALAVLGQMCTAVFLPWGLSPDYSYNQIPLMTFTGDGIQNPGALPYIGVVMFTFLAMLVSLMKGRRLVAFSIGSGFLCLLPTANLFVLIGTIRADRFLYLANLWFALALALILHEIYRRLVRRPPRINPWTALPIVYLAALFLLTFFRCSDWQTNRQFWQSAYDNSPNSFRACLGYGSVLSRTRDLADFPLSNQLLDRAFKIYKDTALVSTMSQRLIADAKSRWGVVLAGQGRMKEAALLWEEADQIYTDIIAFRSAQLTRASQGIDRTVSEGVIIGASIGKAMIALELNRVQEAAQLLDSITDLGGADLEFLTLRSKVHARSGEWDLARIKMASALLLNDNDPVALEALSQLLNDRLPPGWSPDYSNPPPDSPKPSAPLNMNDPKLRSLVSNAADELIAHYRKNQDARSAKNLIRKLRHRIGITNYGIRSAS